MSADNLLARAVAEAQEAERTKAREFSPPQSPRPPNIDMLFACAMVAGGIAGSHGLNPEDLADRSIAIVDALWSRLQQRQANSIASSGPAAETTDPALV